MTTASRARTLPVLTVGSMNLKFGRPLGQVVDETGRFVEKHRPHVVAVQEARGYYRGLRDGVDGYTYFTGDKATCALLGVEYHPALTQLGFLVADELVGDNKFRTEFVGDGWFTVDDKRHAAMPYPRITVDWLRLGNVHNATPIEYHRNADPTGPPERVDDVIDEVIAETAFLKRRGRRANIGDFNSTPDEEGRYSPSWMARQAAGECYFPPEKAGHGRIDGIVSNRFVEFEEVHKDLKILERSDHEFFTALAIPLLMPRS